jgi:hypothetical protein
MNWLVRFAQHIVPLSVNGLQQILATAPDMEGQGYLFEGPGTADLRQMRAAARFKDTVNTALNYFHSIFESMADDIRVDANYTRVPVRGPDGQPKRDEHGNIVTVQERQNYPEPTYDYDEQRLEEEIGQYADMYVADLDFTHVGDDDWENFLQHLDDGEQLPRLFKDYYEQILGRFNVPEIESVQPIWKEIQEYAEIFASEGVSLRNSMDNIQAAYQAASEDPDDVALLEEFYQSMGEISAEMLSEIMANNERLSWITTPADRRKDLPGTLEWIDDKKFQEQANDTFDNDSTVSEWYAEYHKDSLRNSAEESMAESDSEYAREHAREMYHRFGFNPYDLFTEDYYREPIEDDDDERKDIEISSLLEIIEKMREIGGVSPGVWNTSGTAAMYIQGIREVLSQHDALKDMFSNELNRTAPESRMILDGIESNLEHPEQIPGELRANDAIQQIILQREMDRDRQEEARRLFEEQQRLQQEEQGKFHHMLRPGQGKLTPEELAKLKELGLANRPFPHAYSLQRGSYPGSGYGAMPKYLEPFQISVSPTSDMVRMPPGRRNRSREEDKDRIPYNLMTGLPFHTVEQVEGVPTLGWVGGYADYAEKVFYITEVQSDIMQRTPYMRDPGKAHKFWENEVARLERRIQEYKANAQQPQLSPRERIQQKIDSIMQEQQKLLYMERMGHPQTAKYQNNEALLQKLQQQLQRAPAEVAPNRSGQQLAELQRQLQTAKDRLGRQSQTDELYGTENKDPRKWHDWRSRVENRFKD